MESSNGFGMNRADLADIFAQFQGGASFGDTGPFGGGARASDSTQNHNFGF